MNRIWDSHDFTVHDLTPKDFCHLFGRRKVKREDELGAETFNEIKSFFTLRNPKETKVKEFKALKFRWGFTDKIFHTLKETSELQDIKLELIFELDKQLIERLGFFVNLTNRQKKCGLNYKF